MKTPLRFLLPTAVLALLAAVIFFYFDPRPVRPTVTHAPEREGAASAMEGREQSVGAARSPERAPLESGVVQVAAVRQPPPGAVELEDGYPIMGKQRTFFRRAGAVAVQPRGGETVEQLSAPGGALAGFTEVRRWPGGVVVLQAPEAEVARQVAEPARARAWLEEVRAAGAAEMANPVLIEPESGLMMIPFGEIIVRLKEGVDAAAYFGADFARTRRLDGTTDQFVLPLRANDFETTVAEIKRHAARPEVVWAEPNFIAEIREAFIPNDPLFGDQWHLGGDTSGAIGFNRADVRAETAWDTTRGEPDIVVAVIEFRGFDIDHEDLAPNLFINPGEIAGNGIDDDNNGVVDDVNGYDFFFGDNDPRPDPTGNHGTAVAGVAIARGNNGLGVSGAAPRCRFMPVNIGTTSAGHATTLRYCAGLTGSGWRGADVVNMSIGVGESEVFNSGLADAARKGRQGRGTVLLAAAGNSAGAWFDVRVPLAAGTHNFEWRYSKGPNNPAGENAVWVDDVGFFNANGPFVIPQYGFSGFGDGAPGFTSGGAANWFFHQGSDRSTGILDSTSVRSGAIGNNQTSSLFFTKTLSFPTEMRFKVWVDCLRNGQVLLGDTFAFFANDTQMATISGRVISGETAFATHATNNAAGVVIFASGSEYATDPLYPARHPDVICVGASTDYDRRSDYSQYGAKLEIVAPSGGGDLGIVTTDRSGGVGYDPGNYASFRTESGFSGTSSASPLAAGVTALALSVNPWMTQNQVQALLRSTADKIGGVTYDANGHNQFYGYGRVNAANIVLAAGPSFTGYTQNFNAFADNTGEFNDGSSFYANNQRQTVGNVGGWSSFANAANRTADVGTTANVNVSALATQGGTSAIAFSDTGDGDGLRAVATGWASGANSKAWIIPVNTAGYQTLTVGFRIRSSNAPAGSEGPRDFSVQYSLDGTNWTDSGGITAGSGAFNAYGNPLPQDCDDRPGLRLRLLMTSNTSVTGGTVAAAGQCHLDDILITGAPIYSTASVQGGALRLHELGTPNTLTAYVLPNLGFGVASGFDASFRYRVNVSSTNFANGFSFNYGPLRQGTNQGEQGFGQGLSVQFDTFLFGTPGHYVEVNGAGVPGGATDFAPHFDSQWHTVKIRWRKVAGTGINSPIRGHLTLSVDDEAIFRDLPLNFDPEPSDTVAFAARTGGSTEDLFIDDVSVQPLGPEQYSRGYDGLTLNQTALGDGSATTATVAGSVGVDSAGGRVGYRLSKNSATFNLTSYALPALGSAPMQGFEATFLYYMASTFANPADGFAFNFGNLASTNRGEDGLADGLAVGWNLFNARAHQVFVDGVLVPGGQNPVDPFVDGQWHAVTIRWERTATASGALTLLVDGVALFDALPTPGFTAAATDRFVFTARTGAFAADILIDDVLARPLFTSPFPLTPLTIRRNPNVDPNVGVFPLRWGSVPGRNHRVEFSNDLVTWQPLTTRAGIDGFDFITSIVSLPSTPRGFYRVIRE